MKFNIKKKILHEELPTEDVDPLMSFLNKSIKIAVKFLAILMVLVIFWSVIDVVHVFYTKLSTPPLFLLTIADIFKLFAAFLVVLIAIEIYHNIVLYIRTDVIPVNLVIATALMAIARKVIIFDFEEVTSDYVFATGFVVLALGIVYFLLNKQRREEESKKGKDLKEYI